MTSLSLFRDRAASRLEMIYGAANEPLLANLVKLVEAYGANSEAAQEGESHNANGLTERDIALITYADQIQDKAKAPLAVLRDWLLEERLDDLLSVVHLLPFFPYSSDDGFSVIDYLQVDPECGGWADVAALGESFDLMFDLVLNHVSQQSAWFQAFLRDESPYSRFFISDQWEEAWAEVVRPRSHPLFTPFETASGTKQVWTTFSNDQVDLNYAEPAVLLEMIRTLLEYVRRGARIIRLDAVAFLWKRPGTSCIHLPETHEVVKLFRDVLEVAAPHAKLITETNVPHKENVSYFGDGDEADLVYQFSLPPLLLDAYLNADATIFQCWLANLAPPPQGATFFNFTASHDGIGVRPLEGLVSDERLLRLQQHVKDRGGLVSLRAMPDGSQRPYELNISYVDAMRGPAAGDSAKLHARQFLASQSIMLALAGLPAVYFHSLVGSPNDHAGVESTGQPRRINRHKYCLDRLRSVLNAGDSLQHRVYTGYRKLLEIRSEQPAFHPQAAQRVCSLGDDQVIGFLRESSNPTQRIACLANLSGDEKTISLDVIQATKCRDLINESTGVMHQQVKLQPLQASWLELD